MKIAFRRTPPTNANILDKLTSAIIKYKLSTIWPHVGFVIDDVLYHSSGKHGLNESSLTEAKWDLIDIGPELDERAIKIFNELKEKGAGYDWVELFTFTPLRPFIKLIRKIKWIREWLDLNVFCYQLLIWVLTNKAPTTLSTPEQIMFIIIEILNKKLSSANRIIALDNQYSIGNNDGQ